ncbi:MAG: GNAT family N-acetyltransferase [Defluviitaleaceae bacterium]|nr:GNAT family N-acetyltransferase [Defluviitaleaceae bacterium]
MVYRLATPADAACLAELFWKHTDEFEPCNPADKDAFISECAENIAQRLGADLYCWVVEIDGRIVAHANVIVAQKIPRPGKIVRRWGRLSTVRTVPEFRNQGTGGELMEKIKAWSREQGFEELLVGPSEKSVQFYERAGFKNDNEIMELLF